MLDADGLALGSLRESDMLSGHLIPLLSPSSNQCDPRKAPKPLEMPASFGREDLLLPFTRACLQCRRRRNAKRPSPPPKKKVAATSPLCPICDSIQAMAKFIPRKDFLCFTRHGSGSANKKEHSFVLAVSGLNSSRLVRVCSYRGETRKSTNLQEDPQKIAVYDHDTVSLLWYTRKEGGIKAPPVLEPLVRFRIATVKKEDAFEMVVGNKLPHSCVGVTLPMNTTNDTSEKDSNDTTNHVESETKKTQKNDGHHAKSDLSKAEEMERGRKCDDRNDETESAPLTLPSQFAASYSKSFSLDSPEKSQPLHSTYAAKYNSESKVTLLSKIIDNSMEAPIDSKEAAKPPNEASAFNADIEVSVPISSVPHDQLVQLSKEITQNHSTKQSSLRHAVLALTLRLTSEASSWDSNFLRKCNTGAAKKDADICNKQETHPHCAKKRWMPRLLQGTHIQLPKKIDSDRV